jgi:fluoroacetyl-CoA thioesterase
MTLAPGVQAAFRYTATEPDTRRGPRQRGVPVLGTPRVLALAERATLAAVARALAAGATTVGVRVELERLARSPVGADLEVAAVLEQVVGRRLEFAVHVHDGDRPVASGLTTRWSWTPPPSSAAPAPGRQVSELRVVAKRAIDAPAKWVYRLIADFTAIIPASCRRRSRSLESRRVGWGRHGAQLPDGRRRADPHLSDAGRGAGPRVGY